MFMTERNNYKDKKCVSYFFNCQRMHKVMLSRHTVVCCAAQENGARANGSEYINKNNKVAIFTHS